MNYLNLKIMQTNDVTMALHSQIGIFVCTIRICYAYTTQRAWMDIGVCVCVCLLARVFSSVCNIHNRKRPNKGDMNRDREKKRRTTSYYLRCWCVRFYSYVYPHMHCFAVYLYMASNRNINVCIYLFYL